MRPLVSQVPEVIGWVLGVLGRADAFIAQFAVLTGGRGGHGRFKETDAEGHR